MKNTLKVVWAAWLLAAFSASTSLYAGGEYIFSAPPRGPVAEETKVYKPIADYLTKVLGNKVSYKHPGNWLTYQAEMQAGVYDIVFDGPHFVSWRMAKTQHEPLVKLPGKLAFSIVVKKDEQRVAHVTQLRGRTVCGLAPPNLATLTTYSIFNNPARQPLVVESKSFPDAYQSVISGHCIAAVMRDKMFYRLQKKNDNQLKELFHSKGIANQAFSAGPRISVSEKVKIVKALLSDEAKDKMQAFNKRFNKKGKPLERAGREEYLAHAQLLKDIWGFDLAQAN
ncbi:MAG: hypothetical protein BMS9Abin36_0706 [Gammaproteobacteria bacterium]|nr:MAG: hypothetical protein BMS9Abin36_0706 [Gammaproteobacteria bacterium]